MKKNFLISTGGSGGHVIPATILYEHLSKDYNIIITTDVRGLKYLDKKNYSFKIINTPRLNNIFLLPINLTKILLLTIKSFFFLRNKKIETIISTGGYMSLPLILASKFLKINIYLIEPNLVLGRSNKYFLRFCKKIFCYAEQIQNFPENLKNKMVIINPLIRRSIYDLKKSSKFNKKITLTIFGGSQGANIFDKKLSNIIVKISKKKSLRVIQQTSVKNIENLKNIYNKNNIENIIFNFDLNFTNNLKDSDLCITRAGASSLAELSFLNIPFISVPLPSSKDNHQLENANYYKNKNCCWTIEQKDFDSKIEEILINILNDKNTYLEKKENLKKLNYQNSWNNVNQKILESMNEN